MKITVERHYCKCVSATKCEILIKVECSELKNSQTVTSLCSEEFDDSMALSQATVMTPVEIFRREKVACGRRAKEVSSLSLNDAMQNCPAI